MRLVRAVAHVFRGLWVVARTFGGLEAPARAARVQQWSRQMLQVLGVALQVRGQVAPGPCLIVSNHVSWLDILAIHAVCPQARFVAKADVRHWPVLGWLIHAVGTLFIERERRRDAMRVVHHMAEALRNDDIVAVFPEGTTSQGHGVLPFHANLLQAAIATNAPVQPLALCFADAQHRPSMAAAYVGDTSLLSSLWAVVRSQELTAHLQWLDPVSSAHLDRRALAQTLRRRIAEAVGAPPDNPH